MTAWFLQAGGALVGLWKALAPTGGDGRLLRTLQPRAVSLGGCPNFVVFYWQRNTLFCRIIFHIIFYKVFPRGAVLHNVYIR